jgi:hypothetical protein
MKLVDMRGLKLRLFGGPGSSPGMGIFCTGDADFDTLYCM